MYYLAGAIACAAIVVLAVALFGWRSTSSPEVRGSLQTALRGDVTLPPVVEPPPEAETIPEPDTAVPTGSAEVVPPEPDLTESAAVSTAGRPEQITPAPTSTSARRDIEAPVPPAAQPAAERPALTTPSTRAAANDAPVTPRDTGTPGPESSPLSASRNGAPLVSTRETPPPVSTPRDAPSASAAREDAPQAPQGAPVPTLNSSLAAPLSATAALPSPPPAPVPDPGPSASSRATEAAPPRVDPQAAVRATLGRYEAAYSGLDVSAARAVWPSVDQRALARAFDGLASQRVALDDCDVLVNGATARATCSGRAEWTPKVGGGQHRQNRRWAFELTNSGGTWQIVRAETK